ncbi:MAG: serine O-acetyltransferase [Bacillota bacterium]|jgi:serine O-acetyltransferase|nr:serine O-acetyltransferase [Bacillota bacterium]
MEFNNKETIQNTVTKIVENYNSENLFASREKNHLPNKEVIIQIIKGIRRVMFPGYFSEEYTNRCVLEYFVGDTLTNVYDKMMIQIKTAFLNKNDNNLSEEQITQMSYDICNRFFEKLPSIQQMLIKDVQAAFDGDPAAKSKEEIIFSYPGLLAIYVYRIAHEFYKEKVPFIPRIMTEYAHSRTGIDINSGAVIGEYFFIDHGTGVVIGETTNIGNNVKLYQGVTLGALSTRSGQLLANVKRHPTIEDNVTIYSGSTILGGETVIGEGSVIGGNAFITESIAPNTKVSVKTPKLNFSGKSEK